MIKRHTIIRPWARSHNGQGVTLSSNFQASQKNLNDTEQTASPAVVAGSESSERFCLLLSLLSHSPIVKKLHHAKPAAEIASPLAALEAMFMTHIDFVSEHPGVPRMLFGELQRSGETLPKRMAQILIRHYDERLRCLLEAGKQQDELHVALNVDAAAVLFIGTIQGLVMQSLLAGDVAGIRSNAADVFAIYRRGISNTENSQ